MALLAIMMVSGSGFPPVEPFTTLFSVLILVTALIMIFYWIILYSSIISRKKTLWIDFLDYDSDLCSTDQHQSICGFDSGKTKLSIGLYRRA